MSAGGSGQDTVAEILALLEPVGTEAVPEEEAKGYDVPAWDCPGCNGVNARFGQDSLARIEVCDDCGARVRITNGSNH